MGNVVTKDAKPMNATFVKKYVKKQLNIGYGMKKVIVIKLSEF
jgi:hypothetical protein